ncbi:type I-C CRISPR-associated protein Cas8c/Csd1 [soil metagenome]
MLRELCELAEREELVGDSAFDMRPVAWIISLNEKGGFLGFGGTHEPEVLPEKSKKKPKEFAKKFLTPRQFNPDTGGTRSSGNYAYFMVDKSDYVLGCAPDGKAKQPPTDKKMVDRLRLFTEKVNACYEFTNLSGIKAVVTFLEGIMQDGLPEDLPKKSTAGDNFAFKVLPERSHLVHELPEVKDYWRSLCQKPVSVSEGWNCLVTGNEITSPSLFPMLKRVPGALAQAGLVSFNSPAFESYGWKSNANAPVSSDAGQAASVALNRLIDPNFVRQDGQVLPRLNQRLGDDTMVCYWAKEAKADPISARLADIMAAESNDSQVVSKFWDGIYRGKAPHVLDASKFYAVTLTGAQGRVIVRDYLETTVQSVQESVAAYFRDLELPPNTPPARGKTSPPHYGFRTLRECLTVTGRADDLPATHSAGIFTTAITGRRFPDALLAIALERMRAEASHTDWIDSVRRDARTALIKAILIRNHNQTIEPTMSDKNTQHGYLLGRLFACIERMQYLALGGDLNKNLAARYFAAASSCPRPVFKNLNTALVHHYEPKAMRKSGGACVLTKRTIADIQSALGKATNDEGLPARLDLIQQGLFAIGYHTQRGEYLNWKRNEAEKAEADPFAD